MTETETVGGIETEIEVSEHDRAHLEYVLLTDDPRPGLWESVESGWAERAVPELVALQLEQDPVHRHKDVLAHTISVTGKTRPDLRLRLAALFHDIGKPATRRFGPDGVTFRHHEAAGARITRRRLAALGFDEQLIEDVSELVRLSGRFKGYADGWSDSAIRRYARDGGHLLGDLNELVRCDCTTRNRQRAERLQGLVDDLEARILELARADRDAAERPAIDGQAVMEHLGLEPGRQVGQALAHLLELKRSGAAVTDEAAYAALDAWWDAQHQA